MRTLILILSLLFFSTYAAAEKGSPLTEYEALLSKDPAVKKVAAWTKVRTALEALAASKPNAKVLYSLASLNRKIFEKHGDKKALDKAISGYEKVARKFASNELADDALLALGDLRANGLKDKVAARAAYFEIIDRFPKGNVAKIAASRVEDKKRPTPVPQIETVLEKPEKIAEERIAEPLPTAKPTVIAATPVATPVETKLEPANTPKPGTGADLVTSTDVYRRPLIVIDPGHGGDDAGAKGVENNFEKNVVLAIAKEFEQLLKERLRARTFLTRSEDKFIPLPERTKLANDRGADLFISIHANASEFKTAQGIETYYLDNTKDKASLKLAERENASMVLSGGTDLSFIMSDLIQNVKLDDSISLAHFIQNSMHQTLSRYYQGVVNLGVKKAPFYVLVGAHMPCILTEVSFIDHPLEGKRLAEERYQRLVAQALYEGVRNYFLRREKN